MKTIKLLHSAASMLLMTSALAALGPATASAHHAFAAEFDRDKPVELTGTVTKVEWTNPHARFYVDAPDPELDDEVVNWNFELGSPNGLMRAGWRRDTLKIGDTISVSGWRARNNAHVANARTVTDGNGRRLFANSSAEVEDANN